MFPVILALAATFQALRAKVEPPLPPQTMLSGGPVAPGDMAWSRVPRSEVYGREDPRPGNFTTRYGSSGKFEALVRQVTGRDCGWFFDVYLRQAAWASFRFRTAHMWSLIPTRIS